MDGPLLIEVWQVLKNFFGGCMYCPRRLIFFCGIYSTNYKGLCYIFDPKLREHEFYCFKMCFGVHVLAKFRGGLMMIFIYRRNFDFCTPKHEV